MALMAIRKQMHTGMKMLVRSEQNRSRLEGEQASARDEMRALKAAQRETQKQPDHPSGRCVAEMGM